MSEEVIPAALSTPPGWERIENRGLVIVEGDRYVDTLVMQWLPTNIKPGTPVPPYPYIRRIT